MEQAYGFLLSFNIMFGLAIFMGCCVMLPAAERMSNSKRLQFIAGASPPVYWLSHFFCQLIMLIPSVGLIVALFAATSFDAFTQHPGHFFLIMMLFFASAAPQNYLLSLLFDQPNRALIWLILWNLMAAEVTILAVGILTLPDLNLVEVGNALEFIFQYLLPQFDAGQAMIDYYSNYVKNSICQNKEIQDICNLEKELNQTITYIPCCQPPFCGSTCWDPSTNYLSFDCKDCIGHFLVVMAGQSVVYFSLLLLIEYRVFSKIWHYLKLNVFSGPKGSSPNDQFLIQESGSSSNVATSYSVNGVEDEDVAMEKQRVTMMKMGNKEGLLVDHVIQRYSSKVTAVKGVSFSVKPGQCFGLLGFNGAGKTSLYRIITCDTFPTSGDVFVSGNSVVQNPALAEHQLGYCPQAVSSVDGLSDQLTGRQQLRLMVRLRGIRGDSEQYVKQLLDFLFLTRYADRPSKTYSGGMRRKLSTAVALVGEPKVLLFDEPTTGMDPAARRQFWKVIDFLRRIGSAVVLTSHSMDECDLLCDKIAVMVKGQLACIGTPSHLKDRFGGGMILICKAPCSSGLRDMLRYIETNIQGAIIKDAHLGTASFNISYQTTVSSHRQMAMSWSAIFKVLEKGRIDGIIEDYSLSHTTLERVFLSFASGIELLNQQLPPQVIPIDPRQEENPVLLNEAL